MGMKTCHFHIFLVKLNQLQQFLDASPELSTAVPSPSYSLSVVCVCSLVLSVPGKAPNWAPAGLLPCLEIITCLHF